MDALCRVEKDHPRRNCPRYAPAIRTRHQMPTRGMAMQDKFGHDVVASRNVRVAYHKSAIITCLRSTNPTVDSDIPYTVDYLHPFLNGCIRDSSKVHSKVTDIAGKMMAEIVYMHYLTCGLIQIIRRSYDYSI